MKHQFSQEQQERIAHALLDLCNVTISDQDDIAGQHDDTPSGRIRGYITKGLMEFIIATECEFERDEMLNLTHTLNGVVDLLEQACTKDILQQAALVDPRRGFGKYVSAGAIEGYAAPHLMKAERILDEANRPVCCL